MGGACRRPCRASRAGGDDRPGDGAGRRPRAVPPLRQFAGCRGPLREPARRSRRALASAGCRVQALSVLPLSASLHRGRACLAPARSEIRRCRAADMPDRARRSADRLPSVGGEASGVRPSDALESSRPSSRPRCTMARSRSTPSRAISQMARASLRSGSSGSRSNRTIFPAASRPSCLRGGAMEA